MSLSLTGFHSTHPRTAYFSLSREAAFAFIAAAVVFAGVLWVPAVLRDPDTLWHITTGRWMMATIQFIFSGKSHPADERGKAVLRDIVLLARDQPPVGRW